jgi:hypothetical protein
LRAVIKKIPGTDTGIQILQDSIQAGLDQVRKYEADDSNWVAPAPVTIDDALDRMADLLFTLNGGKIP